MHFREHGLGVSRLQEPSLSLHTHTHTRTGETFLTEATTHVTAVSSVNSHFMCQETALLNVPARHGLVAALRDITSLLYFLCI